MTYWGAGLLLVGWMVPVICQPGQDADNVLREVLKRMEKVESHIVDLNKKILNQSQQIITQNQEISGLKKQIANLVVNEMNQEFIGSYVSFTAFATEQRSYNQSDHVLFDGIVRNYGSSYFVENSTFVCPFDGYYLFSVSILSGTGTFEVAMMLNDEILLSPYARDDVTYAAASGLVVTQCSAGQMLWIAAFREGTLKGNVYRHSTLSATLLRVV